MKSIIGLPHKTVKFRNRLPSHLILNKMVPEFQIVVAINYSLS